MRGGAHGVIAHSWLALPGHFAWMALFCIDAIANNNKKEGKRDGDTALFFCCWFDPENVPRLKEIVGSRRIGKLIKQQQDRSV